MDTVAAAGVSSALRLLFRLFLSPPPPLRSSRGTDLIPRWDSDDSAAAPVVPAAAAFPSAASARDCGDPQVGAEGAAGPSTLFQGILTTTLLCVAEKVQWKLNSTSIFLLNFNKFESFYKVF